MENRTFGGAAPAGGVDLHTHSTASDGELSPPELVSLARARGLGTIALTDHDSVAGIDAALEAARNMSIQVIPGVELSADVPNSEVHVLGYFIDWHDTRFLGMLDKFREGRYGRAEKMTRRLAALGAPVSFDRVKEIAGDAAIGRPHVAQALLEAGHVATIAEAFDRYIGRNGPAYVERFRLTPEDAVGLILQAGGVPVLAHPREVTNYIPPLVKTGLLGLEVYYGAYDDATRSALLHLADENGLIATGGSDFHGLDKMAHMSGLGDVGIPPGVVDALKRKAEAIQKERARNR
ncbi:MAG: PHP domain-containing protein [Chloroflexi bacterium]|nr:PHP domain-containing protein [Chloroflexota bacterium]